MSDMPQLAEITEDIVDLKGEVPKLELEQLDEAPITLMPKQDEFIFSTAQFATYGGGVGNGKSFAAIIKVYNYCMAYPGSYFLVGRRHATDLRDSTLIDWMQMMRGFGKYNGPAANPANAFIFPNGSQVIFRHLDDLNSLTNMNLSGFWIEQAEEVPEDAFNYLVGRCRRRRSLTGYPIDYRPKIITFNPNGHDWIWRLFDQKRDGDGKPLEDPKDYHLITATTYENRANLPEDYLKGLESRPADWKKRFVEGSFDTKAGRIFEEFVRELHIVPFAQQFEIPEGWERFRSIDHGQNNPTSCHWYAVDFDGNIWVYKEYYKPSASVSVHTRNILDMSLVMGPGGLKPEPISYTVIDPSTHGKTREKDGYTYSVADEYFDAGISTVRGQNSVEAGINRVKEYLKINPTRWHPFKKELDGTPLLGSPRIFIFEKCEKLIEELPEYQWQQIKYGAMANEKEAPVKKFDHAVDDLRYAIMSRPISPSEAQSIDPNVWRDPIRLALYAKSIGRTKDDLIVERSGAQSGIRHSTSGISHSDSGISHQRGL